MTFFDFQAITLAYVESSLKLQKANKTLICLKNITFRVSCLVKHWNGTRGHNFTHIRMIVHGLAQIRVKHIIHLILHPSISHLGVQARKQSV